MSPRTIPQNEVRYPSDSQKIINVIQRKNMTLIFYLHVKMRKGKQINNLWMKELFWKKNSRMNHLKLFMKITMMKLEKMNYIIYVKV